MGQRICSIDDCERRHYAHGWCQSHYGRWYRNGDPEYKPPAKGDPDPCSVDGCDRFLTPPYGRGMCSLHYRRWRIHGDPNYQRPVVVGVAPCSIEGCEKVVAARGWCVAHWTRWKRHGSPTARLRGEVVDGKRICPTCGKDKPLSAWTKGECKKCAAQRSANYRERNPYRPVAGELRQCDYCGQGFLANKRRSRYCSTECFETNKNRANWPHMVARQKRMRGAIVERFDRVEIFERDGWLCGICDDPISPELRWPDPQSASLDHIIPISRGGKHSRANAQASHLVCNLRKAASLP